jgi:hypothetical protein
LSVLRGQTGIIGPASQTFVLKPSGPQHRLCQRREGRHPCTLSSFSPVSCPPSPVSHRLSGRPPLSIVHRPRPFPPSTLPLSQPSIFNVQPSTDNICSSKKRKFKEQLRNKSSYPQTWPNSGFSIRLRSPRPPSPTRPPSSTAHGQSSVPNLQSSTFNFQSAIFDPPKT